MNKVLLLVEAGHLGLVIAHILVFCGHVHSLVLKLSIFADTLDNIEDLSLFKLNFTLFLRASAFAWTLVWALHGFKRHPLVLNY